MPNIPPKLRSNVAALCGYDDPEGVDVALTTALVALANYASQKLVKDRTLLVVSSPRDPHVAERKAARISLRNRGREKVY